MKNKSMYLILVCLILAGPIGFAAASKLTVRQLDHPDLPAGSARDVLSGSGALLHLQLHDVIGVLEGVEDIVVAGLPDKALPPDAQELMQTEHPLLTLLGLKFLQQPLTPEALAQTLGLDTRQTVSLTLYFGDPRRMFVVGLPVRSQEAMVAFLNAVLEPSEVESVTISGNSAVRLVSPKIEFIPELYLVSSNDMLFICGDRSLVQSLYHTPTAQRFAQDSFLSRALPEVENKQLRVVINPAMAKPLALQLQGVRMIAKSLLPQQRAKLLQQIPREAREQMELQVRTQLGVRDLEEFADYAECIIVATMEQFLDYISGRMIAFEGWSLSANLQGGLMEINTGIYSHSGLAKTHTAALPLPEIKQALAWLGPEFQSFKAEGRKPAPRDKPVLRSWVKRVQKECEIKGLKPAILTHLMKMLEQRAPVPTVESQVPWTLTTYAPLSPTPSLADAASLQDYMVSLDLPVMRPVKIMSNRDLSFLESCWRSEMETLNQNRELELEFANHIQKQNPWCLQENRFQVSTLRGGVTRYARESAWVTRTGLFGYDQHELINRKVVHARQVDDYLIYHRGAKSYPWLADLEASSHPGMAPGVARLLENVPEGANYVSLQRCLVELPQWVAWFGTLESRLYADAEAYIEKAQALVDKSDDLEAARHQIRGLKMPEIIGSVHLNPETRKVYALLPTGEAPLRVPRPKLVPLLQKLLQEYTSAADSVGGSLVYSIANSEGKEWTAIQSTESLTTLTRTFGNALFENYLASSEKQQKLVSRVSAPGDGDSKAFNEVVARNPQWAFIPQPKPKVPAEPTKEIPRRSAEVSGRHVDLSAHYNGALNESWHRGGMANNTLKDLPRGLQEFGDVAFDIRGIVQLSGRQAENELEVQFPEAVSGIAVEQKADRLHFLHACGWPSPSGTRIGSYVVHYANGESRTIPIAYNVDVTDWWLNEDIGEVNVVWKGKNHSAPDGPPLGLCMTTWTNPLPEVKITSLDYHSDMQNSAPFLIAVTVE
jgi:hypothetical protein